MQRCLQRLLHQPGRSSSVRTCPVRVKLKRLEDRLGTRLIERTPRQVRLSAQGEIFMPSARAFLAAHERALAELTAPRRRFRLGIAAHVMGPEVPVLLAKLKALDPALTIEVLLDNSRALIDGFEGGTLDAVILRSDDNRRGGEILGPEHFGWFAAADFAHRAGEPLRLATTAPCCAVRDVATRLLDRASVPWEQVFIGGTAAIAAALSAGLAVSAYPRRLAPADVTDVGDALGLPPLLSLSLVLHSSLSDPKTEDTFRAIAAAASTAGPVPGRPASCENPAPVPTTSTSVRRPNRREIWSRESGPGRSAEDGAGGRNRTDTPCGTGF